MMDDPFEEGIYATVFYWLAGSDEGKVFLLHLFKKREDLCLAVNQGSNV